MTPKVKFRSEEEIRAAADTFRTSKELKGFEIPPLDVIYIAEVVLKLDVVPLKNLFAEQHIDAALMPDLSGIYIDDAAYLAWENGRPWVESRLRFSFAHELGHLTLHADEIAAGGFNTIEEFREWAGNRQSYANAEYQANEFAGRLLVPLDLLTEEYDALRTIAEKSGMPWREIEGMRSFCAEQIAPKFGVNHQVIEMRLDREGLWSAE